TFEDPAFREPPAAVAAAVPAPPPAVGAAVGPAGAPPGPPSEPRIRRRTGATTSIERSVRIEARKEKQLVTYIAVGAAVFVGLLIVLIMLPSGGETPAAKQARQTYEKGRTLFHQGKLDEAHLVLSRVPADPKTIHTQAQSLLREIEAARQRMESALGVEQRKEFDELYDFCEKNRANPRAYETMVQRCETFKQKYPKHPQMAKVDEWLAVGLEGRKAARSTELEGAERQAQEALKKEDYATALRAVNGVRERFRDELAVRERLDKLRDEILDKARTHTFRKRAEAQDAAARGRKDEAIRILEGVVISMGDGNVEELAEFALLARTGLQGLK
ncbi:MAG TPA: hypothetical protein VEJ18_18355, partial [Planctomycetota bacterium]|nr:hypothetical protein [Planctomycetota bacterium]